MRSLYAFILIAFACAASGQEKPSFKGVPMGTPAPEFFSIYKPGGTWAKSGMAAELFLSEKDYALIAVPPSEAGKMGDQIYQILHKDSVAGVEARTKFFFAIQDTATFVSLKRGITRDASRRALLQRVEATFENRDADSVYAALVQKYGEPTRIDERKIVTVGRAQSTEISYYVWILQGAKVEYCKVAPPKGKPLFVIESDTVKSLAAQAGAAEL